MKLILTISLAWLLISCCNEPCVEIYDYFSDGSSLVVCGEKEVKKVEDLL